MTKYFLVLNAGSSTLKSSIFHVSGESTTLKWSKTIETGLSFQDRSQAERLLKHLFAGEPCEQSLIQSIDVVGHRIVHGGSGLTRSTRVDRSVKKAIASLGALAPLHNGPALTVLEAAEVIFPKSIHITVFDTAFHRTIAEPIIIYPVPYQWYADHGIRRFGFHGLSHQYCSRTACGIADISCEGSRVVSCHLGNGCSVTAVRDGRSIDTTMGFTPLDGIMMGTRSGSVDPGILLHVLKNEICTIDELDDTLNRRSGLFGITGNTSDMRTIEQRMSQNDLRAKLAFNLFVHRLCQGIAAMCASAGGIDLLAFTGGIGENSSLVRQAVCQRLNFLGIDLDTRRNEAADRDSVISSRKSQIPVVIVKAREDLEMVNECRLALDSEL